MRILVINQPLNNRGDESAHKAFMSSLAHLSDTNITMLFVGGNPDSIEQFKVLAENINYVRLEAESGFVAVLKLGIVYGIRPIWYVHPLCRKILSFYKQADLVVCAPGGICLGGFQNWQHLALLDIARTLHKPLAYYGRSFGPFPTSTKDNRRFKKAALPLLRYMNFISIRDRKSEEIAKQMNLKYESTVDSAFLRSPSPKIPNELLLEIGSDDYVVFVPNSLTWHYAYKGRVTEEKVLEFYAGIIDVLFEQYPSSKIVMLPQIFNSGEAGGDENFFKTIKNYYDKNERLVVMPETISSDIQQAIIANAQLMVGARYHSIVFAINNATPFVALSYEHKISGLLSTLDKTVNMMDITHAIDNEEAISYSIDVFREKILLAKCDTDAQCLAKKIASNCFSKFAQFIGSIKP